MNIYTVRFTPTAAKSIKRLPKEVQSRVKLKLNWLKENADIIKHIPLKGPFKGFYKLRMGNYRIIYEIDYEEFLIVVHFVGHRKEIYQSSLH